MAWSSLINRNAWCCVIVFLTSRTFISGHQTAVRVLMNVTIHSKTPFFIYIISLVTQFAFISGTSFASHAFITSLSSKYLEFACSLIHPNLCLSSPLLTSPPPPRVFLCISSLRHTASPRVDIVSRVTVTPLVPSRLIVMNPVSVAVSQASVGPNVTAAHEDSSTSRRAAAHVSLHSRVLRLANPPINTQYTNSTQFLNHKHGKDKTWCLCCSALIAWILFYI